MNSAHRAVAVVLIIGALACSSGGGGPTSTIGPTNSGGTSALVGPWNANVVANNSSLHESCTIAGSLVISQTGTGAAATLGGNFTGTQTCSGMAGNSQDSVVGPTSSIQVSRQQISFSDGLGLTYVGSINSATAPTAASGTALGTLTTPAGMIQMSATWTMTR